ncbi:hypothetical protein [Bacillus taeanensis]|uniref:Uncharacterized protein n=1 Tax=Bacillus taeanensis TaxID=273032 RepID=A0A366XWT6_9BACI|nr:hypothetical protein [Bacillus taeanensis]RBW69615.1 hypothetical protein DS031_10320 [Bacillus taeanensis]
MDVIFQLIIFAVVLGVLTALSQEKKEQSTLTRFFRSFLIGAGAFLFINFILDFFQITLPSDQSGFLIIVFVGTIVLSLLIRLIKK